MESPAVIDYPPVKRVILFGGTPLMGRLCAALKAKGISVVAYTSPRHAADCGMDLHDASLNISMDINSDFPLVLAEGALGIGIGEAWKFGAQIRAAFGDRLVDFMSIPYPAYLGGAHLSHAILRGERSWGLCLQLVTENTSQGEIHDGDIIDGCVFSFPDLDEHKIIEHQSLAFLTGFALRMQLGCRFQRGANAYACKRAARTFPRLNTHVQGWIDWTWRRNDVIAFIRAFDAPYHGARTQCWHDNQASTVIVHDAVDHSDETTHPFHAGLVVARCDDRLRVSVGNGVVSVRVTTAWIKPGMRLCTEPSLLHRALTYTPNYTPMGDENER